MGSINLSPSTKAEARSNVVTKLDSRLRSIQNCALVDRSSYFIVSSS